MTRMIPEAIPSTVKSNAEKRIFKLIRDAPGTAGWVCLYSVIVHTHERKRRAEIDFVLLTPQGIFAIEVKGGGLSCDDGVWHTISAGNVKTRLKESPFEQASGGRFALEEKVKAKFGGKPQARALFGYGVMAPRAHIHDKWAADDQPLAYDDSDKGKSLTAYVERIAAVHKKRAHGRGERLKRADIDELASFLAGNFVSMPSPEAMIGEIRGQLNELTQEQSLVLDVLEDTERVIVDGGAGTGKTLLAVKAARKMATDGKRVLFLCFNKLLASRLRDRLDTTELRGELLVRNLHHHYHELILESSFAAAFEEKYDPDEPDKDKLQAMYRELFPEYAFYAASELEEPPFDAIVIDEAQDILTTANLDALDAMLRGGLETGRWCVFLDTQDQVELYKNMDQEALDRLRRHGDRQTLTLNCRNTRPIARDTAVVSRSKRPARARVTGRDVDFRTYKKRDSWTEQLARIVTELRTEGVPAGQLSVLLPHKPTRKEAAAIRELGLVQLTESDVLSLGTTNLEHITWSTVHSFKGLENDVVILVGVNDIEDDWQRSVAYVGMSRARTRLYVVLTEGCERERRRRVKEHEEKRNSDVGMLL